MHRTARAAVALRRAALVIALVVALGTPSIAAAQLPPGPPPPQPSPPPQPGPLADGDIAWAFANENPLFDSRLSGALGTAMAPFVQDGAPAGTRIVRVEAQGPDLRVAPIYPATDVQKLLDASGFGNRPPFVVVGPCRTWSASPAAAAALPLLDAALRKTLGNLGVTIEPCTPTTNPAEAHLLAWRHGADAAPALAQRTRPTFLGPNLPPAGPPPASAPGVPSQPTAPGTPRPAVTGAGGVEAARDPHPAVLVLLLVFGAMMVAGGRRITRRA